jgi:hypothetical protein
MKHKPLPKLTPRQIYNFGVRVKPKRQCWEWQGALNKKGYGKVRFGKTNYLSHRVAYYVASGIDPGRKLVCHKCDNRKCCRPDHVFLGTVQNNNADMVLKRRHRSRPPGAKHPHTKLNDEKARKIKYSTEPNPVLAKRHGVSSTLIGCIKRGESWAHV